MVPLSLVYQLLGLAPCGRVLPCQLRRRPLQSFLLPLEPSFPGPRTLHVVSHVQAQPAQPLRLQLDQVAFLEGAEPAVVGSGSEDIAGLQGVDRADPFDAPRNLVGHVARVEVLLERSVHPEPYLEFVRVGYLIGGHEIRADGGEGVARLHLVERVAGGRQAPGRPVDEVRVSEDVAHGLRYTDTGGPFAHEHPQPRLTLEDSGGGDGGRHAVARCPGATWWPFEIVSWGR